MKLNLYLTLISLALLNFSFINGPSSKDSCSHIYTVAEEMPQYPGGDKALNKYIRKNLKHPKVGLSLENGTVVVSFVVDSQGKVNDAKILKGLMGSMNEEALKVITNMPLWTPGKQNGSPVCVECILPIRFKK